MTNKWTPNQQSAIDTIGQNMPIAACAGSGAENRLEYCLLGCRSLKKQHR